MNQNFDTPSFLVFFLSYSNIPFKRLASDGAERTHCRGPHVPAVGRVLFLLILRRKIAKQFLIAFREIARRGKPHLIGDL